MFSHASVGVKDFDRALAFYRSLMPVLGVQERFCEPIRPWAGWQSHPGPRPLFLIGRPYDGAPQAALALACGLPPCVGAGSVMLAVQNVE